MRMSLMGACYEPLPPWTDLPGMETAMAPLVPEATIEMPCDETTDVAAEGRGLAAASATSLPTTDAAPHVARWNFESVEEEVPRPRPLGEGEGRLWPSGSVASCLGPPLPVIALSPVHRGM